MSAAALNNREWATLTWLFTAFVLVLLIKDVRKSIPGLLKTALTPKISLPLLAMFIYLAGLVVMLHSLGLWSSDLTKDTIIWVLGPAVALFFRAGISGQSEHFFRQAVIGTIKFTVLVEFYINLFVLPLWAELLLLPVITMLVLLSTVAGTSSDKEQYRPVKVLVDQLIGLIGLALTTYVAVQLVRNWPLRDAGHDLRSLTLPILMTIGLLPFIYALSLWATYEGVFLRINFATDDTSARRRAKVMLLRMLNVHVHQVGQFKHPWLGRLARSTTSAEARGVLRQFKANSHLDDEES